MGLPTRTRMPCLAGGGRACGRTCFCMGCEHHDFNAALVYRRPSIDGGCGHSLPLANCKAGKYISLNAALAMHGAASRMNWPHRINWPNGKANRKYPSFQRGSPKQLGPTMNTPIVGTMAKQKLHNIHKRPMLSALNSEPDAGLHDAKDVVLWVLPHVRTL